MVVRIDLVMPRDDATTTLLDELVAAGFTSRLFAQDPTLWGEAARDEAAIRLSWVDSPTASRPLVPQILQLRDELRGRGVDRVVLCGMGGSSLAPEVICAAAGVPLDVLDSSQPDMVRSAVRDLATTVVVVSSKSGGTVETDSQRRVFEQAYADAGLNPADHLVIVTDPDSPLDDAATAAGYRVFHADPQVGGRYSALTAFGLVPSGLAGADIAALLDQAEQAAAVLAGDDRDNPALRLAAAMGAAVGESVDKLLIVDREGRGLADWIEQLIAESTGKDGTGVLPIAAPGPDLSPTADEFAVALGGAAPEHPWAAGVAGSLGAQFLTWEVATAALGRILSINPFDQPDVESAKSAARELLGGGTAGPPPDHAGDVADLYGTTATDLAAAVRDLLAQVGQTGYLSLQLYLDRWAHAGLERLAPAAAARLGRPVSFGWGPRFLHSTGQYHKGGAPHGVFLQVTCDPIEDLAVPGRDFTLGEFIASQAAGDAQVLRDRGRPLLRVHLHDVAAGLAALEDALT